MGIKSTVTIDREHAIGVLTWKILNPIQKRIEFELSQLSNKELEDLMDEYADDDFTNFWVVDKIED